MDYNRIVQEILNIGEELLKSGAEVMDLCEVTSMLRRLIFK